MNVSRGLRTLACAATLTAACFSPDLPDGAIACGEAGCPIGMLCHTDGLCYRDPPANDPLPAAHPPAGAIDPIPPGRPDAGFVEDDSEGDDSEEGDDERLSCDRGT